METENINGKAEIVVQLSLKPVFETIINQYKMLLEFQESCGSDVKVWMEKIQSLFSMFGFESESISERLFYINEHGNELKSNVLVCILGPTEDNETLLPGLNWEEYLFYLAKHYFVEWVILTNGLDIRLFNYSNEVGKAKESVNQLSIIKEKKGASCFLSLPRFLASLCQSGVENIETEHGVHRKRKTLSEREKVHIEFWTQFLERSRSMTDLFSGKSPTKGNYIGQPSEIAGIDYLYTITSASVRIQLYIDNKEKGWNKKSFDRLIANQEAIETAFGESLVWDRLDEKRASVIRYVINQFGRDDRNHWEELQELMIDKMIRFVAAFEQYL